MTESDIEICEINLDGQVTTVQSEDTIPSVSREDGADHSSTKNWSSKVPHKFKNKQNYNSKSTNPIANTKTKSGHTPKNRKMVR